jgi:phosphatidylglycerophosphate synthase/putative flippase GtrA
MTPDLAHWLGGRLSGVERVVSAAAPAFLLLGYFLVAGLLYGARRLTRGQFHDEEMETRPGGGLTAMPGLRHFFAWTMRPWWRALARVNFPPNVITSLSLALALAAGVGVAAGRFALGGWLFVSSGALDFLDGRVARTTGRTTPGGAVLDSILDRYVESALIVGLAWYYRDSWVLFACLLALTGSLLVPYVRARGEAAGVQMVDKGFLQRPERVVLLGAGTALSPILEVVLAPGDPHPPHRLAIAALVIVAFASHATAVQRAYGLLGALQGVALPSVGRPLKSAVTNGFATAFDFVVASVLVHVFEQKPSLATALGCLVGGVIAYVISRVWVFSSGGAGVPQASRYAFVSGAGAFLNAGGVALISGLNVPFVVGWCLARVVVFATWSYPAQRDFVFAEERHGPEPSLVSRP